MSILMLLSGLGNYWKLILGVIAGLLSLFFGANYVRRGKQVADSKNVIKEYKAKDDTAKEIQKIDTQAEPKLKDIEDAKKSDLTDKLNNLPK